MSSWCNRRIVVADGAFAWSPLAILLWVLSSKLSPAVKITQTWSDRANVSFRPSCPQPGTVSDDAWIGLKEHDPICVSGLLATPAIHPKYPQYLSFAAMFDKGLIPKG